MCGREKPLVATRPTMDTTRSRLIHRFSGERLEVVEDILVAEQQVTLFVNREKIISTACSPGQLRELAYGFLLSSGRINAADDVALYREEDGLIHVDVRPCQQIGDPLSIVSTFSIRLEQMLKAAAEVHRRGEIFQRTGGTHAVAVCDSTGGMIFAEDISRTCALEKAIGEALLSEAEFPDRFIFLSSRISSHMLIKIARCGIPIVGCVSAPTAQAAELADKLGICLCGFVRGERLNIYSHEERIII